MRSSGSSLVPEDRRRDGLFMRMSVFENTSLAALRRYSRLGWIDEPGEAEGAAYQLENIRAEFDHPDDPVDWLSGGNQQKVLLAKWLLTNPGVLFLDDPTRGIDVGAKDDFYRMISRIAEDGVGIVWVSSELPELIANSHRILVLHGGKVQGIVDSVTATQESVMRLATGGRAGPP
jgi:ABC-type sugar transport system ATPase subunit